ncbi:MAG TPA: tol-pal system protein YbgF [Pseudomonadales bacterium]
MLCAALAAQFVAAAVPVVESQPTTTSGRGAAATDETAVVRSYGTDTQVAASSAPPPSATVGSSSATSMFQQFQQLESDVAELRGIVEEQSNLIQKLQNEQKEQYLDLDRRLSMLLKGQPGAAAPGEPGPATAGTSTTPAGGPTDASTGGVAAAPTSERGAYETAFVLTKNKRFIDAIAAFNQMLVTYPNGEYSGNAYYWLGELYLALPDPALEKSRQSFAQVVNKYPSNVKIADATYKLGVVYHRLGDRTKAMEFLSRAQSQFPGTPAAKLAQSYAAELR